MRLMIKLSIIIYLLQGFDNNMDLSCWWGRVAMQPICGFILYKAMLISIWRVISFTFWIHSRRPKNETPRRISALSLRSILCRSSMIAIWARINKTTCARINCLRLNNYRNYLPLVFTFMVSFLFSVIVSANGLSLRGWGLCEDPGRGASVVVLIVGGMGNSEEILDAMMSTMTEELTGSLVGWKRKVRCAAIPLLSWIVE